MSPSAASIEAAAASEGVEIRATFFREAVDQFYDVIQPSQVYYFSGGKPGFDNAPAANRGVLHDDVVLYPDGFNAASKEKLCDALLDLDEKKAGQENPSNIKVLVNSPGGSVWAAQEIRGTIAGLDTPVDVIVTGMAASA